MTITLPSLKERIDDVEELAEHLRVKLCNKFGVYSEGISKEAIDYLKSYDWPGNVRELENVIERAINLLNAELIIMPEHLPKKILQANKEIIINQGKQLKHVTDELEKEMILQVLNESKGNKNEAAKKLGISRQGLYKKIKRLNLEI